MDNLCSSIICKLIKYAGTSYSASDLEIYTYGLLSLLYSLIPSIILLIIAFIQGFPFEMLSWIFIFLTLRKYAGGLHAKSSSHCLCYSILIGISALIICPYITHLSLSTYSLNIAINFIPLIILAPATEKNFSIKEKRLCKKKLFIFLFFFTLVIPYIPFMQSFFLHALFCTTLPCIAQHIKTCYDEHKGT